ncbi:hypothetical protein F4861DRAFT_501648, partial [Xylaria intraflava]
MLLLHLEVLNSLHGVVASLRAPASPQAVGAPRSLMTLHGSVQEAALHGVRSRSVGDKRRQGRPLAPPRERPRPGGRVPVNVSPMRRCPIGKFLSAKTGDDSPRRTSCSRPPFIDVSLAPSSMCVGAMGRRSCGGMHRADAALVRTRPSDHRPWPNKKLAIQKLVLIQPVGYPPHRMMVAAGLADQVDRVRSLVNRVGRPRVGHPRTSQPLRAAFHGL